MRCMACSAMGWGLPVICLHCLRYVALYWVFWEARLNSGGKADLTRRRAGAF